MFTIPYLGFVANYIQHPPGMYVAIAAGAVLLMLTFLPDVFAPEEKTETEPKPKRRRAAAEERAPRRVRPAAEEIPAETPAEQPRRRKLAAESAAEKTKRRARPAEGRHVRK